MIRDYGQDLNIGIPPKDTVVVEQMSTLIEGVGTVTDGIEEVAEENKKIKVGIGLMTGVDLNEEDAE